jgi:hypothetical protein
MNYFTAPFWHVCTQHLLVEQSGKRGCTFFYENNYINFKQVECMQSFVCEAMNFHIDIILKLLVLITYWIMNHFAVPLKQLFFHFDISLRKNVKIVISLIRRETFPALPRIHYLNRDFCFTDYKLMIIWRLPMTLKQCDHIGRIFAYWAIAFFGQFCENHWQSPSFWYVFPVRRWRIERLRIERLRIEQPGVEFYNIEQPRVERPRVECSWASNDFITLVPTALC